MIQIRKSNLDELAEIHYNGIIKNIKTKLDENKVVAAILLKNTTLKEILTARPDKLSEIMLSIPQNKVEQYRNEIKRIFYYKGFYDWKDYNAYDLSKNLQVNVCPYCNRQYTFTVIEKGTKIGKTRPEFDHFWSQSKFPYLALSFYNLIPSCKICNSTFKGEKEWDITSHIHPYQEGFGKDCIFSLKLKTGKGIDFFYGKEDAFEIILKHKGNKRIENNISDLCLNEIYNEHKDYVKEIIQRNITYSDSYMNSLFNQFEGTLFSNIGELQRMISGNYVSEEDLDKRVLAKLSQDISEELRTR